MEYIKIKKSFTHTSHITDENILILKDVLKFSNSENVLYEYKRLMSEYIDENGFKKYADIWHGEVFILCFTVKGLEQNLFYLIARIFNEKNFNYYKTKIGCYYTFLLVD